MSSRIFKSMAAFALFLVVLAVPGVAAADNHCTFKITPANPGWRGAAATIEGFNMSPNTVTYPKFNGAGPISGPMTNGSGYFKYEFTIPNDAPTNSNWVVFAAAGCQMLDARNYTVNATAPTTTTEATTTTTTTTTTTLPALPTTEATTTTAAAETTTTAAATTTTAATGETNTTVLAGEETDDGESGGLPSFVLVILGALVGAGLLFAGMRMGGRRS